jgi:hypothetical protein
MGTSAARTAQVGKVNSSIRTDAGGASVCQTQQQLHTRLQEIKIKWEAMIVTQGCQTAVRAQKPLQ